MLDTSVVFFPVPFPINADLFIDHRDCRVWTLVYFICHCHYPPEPSFSLKAFRFIITFPNRNSSSAKITARVPLPPRRLTKLKSNVGHGYYTHSARSSSSRNITRKARKCLKRRTEGMGNSRPVTRRNYITALLLLLLM